MKVKYQAEIETPTQYTGYLVDGKLHVPMDEGNRHYQEVQEWIAQGNTPEPAFTQAELDAYRLGKKQEEAHKYLNETDWYIAREHDAGKLMPDEVRQKRAEARAILN